MRESPSGAPAEVRALDPAARSLALADLPDGDWRLHLWAVDRAGRTGEPASVTVSVWRAPPAVQELHYPLFATNPHYASSRIRFFVSRPADVVVTVFGAGGETPWRVYDLGR